MSRNTVGSMPGPLRTKGTLNNRRYNNRMKRNNTRRFRREGQRNAAFAAAALALQMAERAEEALEGEAADPGRRRLTLANVARMLVWMAGFFAERFRRRFLEALGQQLNLLKDRATLTLQEAVSVFFAILRRNQDLWRAVSVPTNQASPINRLATVSNSLAMLCTGLVATGALGDLESPVRSVGYGATCVGAACAAANLAVRAANHATGRHPLRTGNAIRLVGDAASGGAAAAADQLGTHVFAAAGYRDAAENIARRAHGALTMLPTTVAP